MQGRHYLVGLATAGAFSALLFGGCGGSSTDKVADAGGDVTLDAPGTARDQFVPDTSSLDAAPACTSDVDLVNLQVADASIGDSGATTATCAACVRAGCASALAACQGECECRKEVGGLFDCLQRDGGSVTACGTSIALNPQSANAQPLGLCLISKCSSQCGTGSFFPDGGGGADSGLDASDGGG